MSGWQPISTAPTNGTVVEVGWRFARPGKPPAAVTCARGGCTATVLTWLDPTYCGLDCRNLDTHRPSRDGRMYVVGARPGEGESIYLLHADGSVEPISDRPGWLARAIQRLLGDAPA